VKAGVRSDSLDNLVDGRKDSGRDEVGHQSDEELQSSTPRQAHHCVGHVTRDRTRLTGQAEILRVSEKSIGARRAADPPIIARVPMAIPRAPWRQLKSEPAQKRAEAPLRDGISFESLFRFSCLFRFSS
jgi:hypothetical protein